MRPALLALTLLLAACSDDDPSTDGTPEPSTTDTAGTVAPAAPTTTEKVSTTLVETSSACEAIGSEMLAAIARGVKPETKASLGRGFAVKSAEHPKAWYIAAEINGPVVEGSGDIGIWASSSLSPAGAIITSVDGMAKQFSNWPDAAKTDAKMRSTDKGAIAARDCF